MINFQTLHLTVCLRKTLYEILVLINRGVRKMPMRNERREWVFKTTPERLSGLLSGIDEGKIALPEFQRNWVWET